MIKMRLIILIALIFSTQVYSLAIGIGAGGLTPHFVSSKRDYCNQWNDTGIIANKSTYLTIASGKYMVTFMKGNDSICSDIEGMFITWGFKFEERMDMGIIFGGYGYIQENWDAHALTTPDGVSAPTPVTIKIGNERFVPVLGLQVGLHLIKSSSGWSLILNNILTPVIFNHSLMLQWRF